MSSRLRIALLLGSVCAGITAFVIALHFLSPAPSHVGRSEKKTASQEGMSPIPSTPLPTTPAIYVSIVSHNEDTSGTRAYDYANDEGDFTLQHDQIIKFAQMVADHGAKYDFQTDWNFLLGEQAFDHGDSATGGKNLLAYLVEDLGMSVDPHSHEHSGYNYADVAYLISTFGISPSTIVGGFIGAPPSDSVMEEFETSMRGKKYPSYTWTPSAMWGAGTSGHTNDSGLYGSGVWRPKSAEAFMTDDPSRVPYLGGYNGDWTGLDDLLAKEAAGELQNDTMYTVTVFTNQTMFTDSYIQAFADKIDSYKNQTTSGLIHWITLPEELSIWQTTYQSTPKTLLWSGDTIKSSLSPENVSGVNLLHSDGGVSSSQGSSSGKGGLCGDGICSDFERGKGACVADCGN